MVGNAIGRFVIRGQNEKLMKFPISTKRISADTSLRVVSKQILFGLIFKAFPCVYLFKISVSIQHVVKKPLTHIGIQQFASVTTKLLKTKSVSFSPKKML